MPKKCRKILSGRVEKEKRKQKQQNDNLTRRNRLSNPDYAQQELERHNLARSSRRSDPDYAQQELDRDNSSRRSRLSNPDYAQQELERHNLARSSRRSNPDYAQQELDRNNLARSSRRSDPDYAQQELDRDNSSRRSRLSNPDYAQQELERHNLARSSRRSNPDYAQQELDRNNLARSSRRSDPDYAQQELDRDNSSRRSRLSNPDYAQQELERHNLARSSRRSNPDYAQQELDRNNLARSSRRSDPDYVQQELDRDNSARSSRRSLQEYRTEELERDNKKRKTRRCQPVPWKDVVCTYENNILEGPIYRCYSCDKLLFKTQIRKTCKEILKNKGCSEEYLEKLILQELRDDENYTFCTTCMTYINKKNFPRFNVNNSNLRFPEIPESIKILKPLEERCVAARIPFMRITTLGCDRQLGIKSGVVNVPVDVRKTINSIPAAPENSGIIEVSLMRRMQYKNPYMKERIRPDTIKSAAILLCATPLYKHYEITYDESWEPSVTDSTEREEETEEDNLESTSLEEDPDEITDKLLPEETLLDSADAFCFAPGEGNIPIPMIMDKHCEELAFPTIWFGHARGIPPSNVRFSFDDFINSEIRRYDRRACRPDHLLFLYKKSQINQLMSQANIMFRKSNQNNNITATQVVNKEFLDHAVAHDHAYKFMSSITGTPPYWESQKKRVLAMVRQLGPFHLFITLSAAETRWPELLVILKKTVDKEDISIASASELSFEEKARLISTDPVTCSQYFYYRFKELWKTWINVENGPFGQCKIINHFFRIEFQHRGSPHVHMVLWLDKVPLYNPHDVSSSQSVIQFINQLVTTNSDDPEIKEFINYQKHKCCHTCYRKVNGKVVCRFGSPFLPMRETLIIEPLSDDEKLSKEQETRIRNISKHLHELLVNESESIATFDDLLVKLNCTYDEYLLVARTSIKRRKIFVKRLPKDCRVNPYNKKILMLMRSNIDVQYVLDVYSCITYVVDYINKSARGISRLIRQCIEDHKRGNYTMREKMKSFSHILYNSSETSAQEAAWARLRQPMASSSVMVEFIHSGPSSSRQKMLKTNSELQKLQQSNPNSTDIYKKGPIERYADRPDELKDICLADFVAKFTYNTRGKSSDDQDNDNDEEFHVEAINPEEDDNQSTRKTLKKFELKNNSGSITERKQPKVIRYCRFSIHQDEDNFFREQCLLFLPWKNEQDIENSNCKSLYYDNSSIIQANYKRYNASDYDIQEILQQIEKERSLEEQNVDEISDSNNEEANSDFVNVYDFDDNVIQPNTAAEMGLEDIGIDKTIKFTVPDMLPDEEYYKLCDSLNAEQRDYLMHLISCFKSNSKPIHHFISGRAGVGKSVLIRAIYQAITRIFRSNAGPSQSNEILLVAYTGMAAHNIGGMTAHSAFNLAANHGNASHGMKPDVANTLACKLWHLKLIIIDEVSMLSSELLNQISLHLKQIFKSKEEFGGRSIIAVGDFSQLKPVGGSWIFQSRESNRVNSTSVIVENPQWSLFKLYTLTKIMRQADDLRFAEALSRIATGETTSEDIDMFNRRCFTEETLPIEGQHATRLMSFNKQVDAYNMQRAQKISSNTTQKLTHHSVDKIIGNVNERQKNQAKHELKNSNKKDTQNLVSDLELVVGLQYMISTNIDVSDGLFNGARGVLKFYEIRNKQVECIYIQFDDKKIGTNARNSRKHIMAANKIPNIWTPILKIKKTFNILKGGAVQISREQFPVLLAEGLTVHKSQGQSMKEVTVFPVGMERQRLYVALSRATSLSGLYIVGKFKPPKKPDDRDPATNEMERMKRESPLEPVFFKLRTVPANTIQIISHNIQSIRKHKQNIIADEVYTQSHLIALQETWAVNHERYDIPNFQEVCRNSYNNIPKAQGTMIFARDDIIDQVQTLQNISLCEGNSHIESTSIKVSNILIINIYKSPSASINLMKQLLNQMKTLIDSNDQVLLIGDFNENFLKCDTIINYLKLNFMLNLNSQKICTTDGKTKIDAAFGRNIDSCLKCNIYESHFSYHKPIVMRLKNK